MLPPSLVPSGLYGAIIRLTLFPCPGFPLRALRGIVRCGAMRYCCRSLLLEQDASLGCEALSQSDSLCPTLSRMLQSLKRTGQDGPSSQQPPWPRADIYPGIDPSKECSNLHLNAFSRIRFD
jgi:hypothetical protein